MKPFVYIGIDPGVTGAIAFFRPEDGRLLVKDMPTRVRASGRHEVHAGVLAAYVDKFYGYPQIAIIEKVAAMTGKESSASSFQFGRSFGICLGVLAAFKLSVLETRPGVWKGMLGLSPEKQDSLDKAVAIFPKYRKLFSRKKDHGRAEAALLAWLGFKFYDWGKR